MWPVSRRFIETVAQSHLVRSEVILTTTWGDYLELDIVAGNVSCQSGQRARRTASLTVAGPDRLYGLLSAPGSRVSIRSGFGWSGTQEELVPQIVGEMSSAVRELGSGSFGVTVGDLWTRVDASTYIDPITPDPAARRVDLIAGMVQDAVPGTRIVNQSTDDGQSTSQQVWESRGDLIQSLATDGGNEAYFDADGSFVIRNSPSITDAAATTLRTGDGGTITALTRTRPLDKLYNTVIVRPSSLDGSQTWTQVVVQITDPNNARHPNRIGVRPKVWQSPSLLSADEAFQVAQIILDKVLGTTESLQLGAIANPALDAGDVIRVLNPTDDGLEIITHFIDSTSIDLLTGEQQIATRSQTELAG